jgi:very-short-patch-repair endonuclease
VEVAQAVGRLGGVCTWRELRRAVPWRRIGVAVESGEVVRLRRGLYGLRGPDDAVTVARRLTGTVSHRSAAAHWGWKVKTTPQRPDVTLARHRRLPPRAAEIATLHWRTLPQAHVRAGVTTPARTVVDCCLDLPFDEALAVFDSALRAGLRMREVTEIGLTLGPRQRARVLKVARHADGRAANPFESVLRAIALEVPGLSVEPQVRVRYDDFYARVDLADESLQIVVEADSHEFHAERRAFDRDCRRYEELTVRDWIVLRFTWEQVMFHPAWVRSMLVGAVALRRRRSRPRPVRRTAVA